MSDLEIKREWIDAAVRAEAPAQAGGIMYDSDREMREHGPRLILQAVAPLIAAEARKQALDEAEHIARGEEYEPPGNYGHYICWPTCTETVRNTEGWTAQFASLVANGIAKLNGKEPRDLPAELKTARENMFASRKHIVTKPEAI